MRQRGTFESGRGRWVERCARDVLIAAGGALLALPLILPFA